MRDSLLSSRSLLLPSGGVCSSLRLSCEAGAGQPTSRCFCMDFTSSESFLGTHDPVRERASSMGDFPKVPHYFPTVLLPRAASLRVVQIPRSNGFAAFSARLRRLSPAPPKEERSWAGVCCLVVFISVGPLPVSPFVSSFLLHSYACSPPLSSSLGVC